MTCAALLSSACCSKGQGAREGKNKEEEGGISPGEPGGEQLALSLLCEDSLRGVYGEVLKHSGPRSDRPGVNLSSSVCELCELRHSA